MQKKIFFIITLIISTSTCFATGMAVAINNVALYNDSSKSVIINAQNINKNAKIKIPPHSACLINQPIMFEPNLINNDSNYYIIFSIESLDMYNAIMIDKQNQLRLASQSIFSKAYSKSGFSKFHLTANCGKQHIASPIKTNIENTPNNPPLLTPKYCSNSKSTHKNMNNKDEYYYLLSFGSSTPRLQKFANLGLCAIN